MQPNHHEPIDVSPVAQVSADAWDQTAPVGGEDFEGRPAIQARAVTIAGITLVRDVPTLAGVAQSYPLGTLATSGALRLLGAAPQRRHVTICADVAVRLGMDKALVEFGSGLILPANTLHRSNYAGEVWVAATAGAGNVSFWAELDQG